MLIDARDLNEVTQIAGRILSGKYGCAEVRLVRELRKRRLTELAD